MQGVEFFVGVTQTDRIVDHPSPRVLQQITGGEILQIHGRVLAHQHDIHIGEGPFLGFTQRAVIFHAVTRNDGPQSSPGTSIAQKEIRRGKDPTRMPARLCRQQHGEGGVLGGLDPGDGVHEHSGFEHAHSADSRTTSCTRQSAISRAAATNARRAITP